MQTQAINKILLYSLLLYSAGCSQYYKAVNIVDGDTFDIEKPINGIKRVRIIGIDTPERKQPGFSEAKQRLVDLILNQKIKLEKQVSETDRFHRLLRDVYVNNRFVNQIMVEEGYGRARTYPPDIKYKQILKEAEKRAKEAQIGIWKPQNK